MRCSQVLYILISPLANTISGSYLTFARFQNRICGRDGDKGDDCEDEIREELTLHMLIQSK